MTALYDAAFTAYRALCELEDELDENHAAGLALTETQRNELNCLRRRWTDETNRKLRRALARPRSAVTT